jgi:hypothetical protein
VQGCTELMSDQKCAFWSLDVSEQESHRTGLAEACIVLAETVPGVHSLQRWWMLLVGTVAACMMWLRVCCQCNMHALKAGGVLSCHFTL